MKALSVKQPWGHLLCSGIKDIENRTWKLPQKYKGKWILIHASGCKGHKFKINLTNEQMISAFGSISKECINGKFDFGAVIGAVKFSECFINANSIWAEKSNGNCKPIYNWKVSDSILLDKPILGVKGKLSFWDFDLPEEYQKLLK